MIRRKRLVQQYGDGPATELATIEEMLADPDATVNE